MSISPSRHLVLGAHGQTGTYLVEHLLDQGHMVFGIATGKNLYSFGTHLNYRGFNIRMDLDTDFYQLFEITNPDTVFNLASMSSVYECNRNKNGSRIVNYLLVKKLSRDLIKYNEDYSKCVKLTQASSSEMYTGNKSLQVVDVTTPISPGSIYGEHKALAHAFLVELRKSGNLVTSSAILFNHESPRRLDHFVSKKITNFAKGLNQGENRKITLGNIDIKRDWGYAKDYAEILLKIASFHEQGDFIVASGELHSVKEFLLKSLEFCDLSLKDIEIVIDNALIRLGEHPGLMGNMSYTHEKLRDIPTTSFEKLVRHMFDKEG